MFSAWSFSSSKNALLPSSLSNPQNHLPTSIQNLHLHLVKFLLALRSSYVLMTSTKQLENTHIHTSFEWWEKDPYNTLDENNQGNCKRKGQINKSKMPKKLYQSSFFDLSLLACVIRIHNKIGITPSTSLRKKYPSEFKILLNT